MCKNLLFVNWQLLMSISVFAFVLSFSHHPTNQPPVLPGWPYLVHHELGHAWSGKPTDWPQRSHRLPCGGEPQGHKWPYQGNHLDPGCHTGTHPWAHGKSGWSFFLSVYVNTSVKVSVVVFVYTQMCAVTQFKTVLRLFPFQLWVSMYCVMSYRTCCLSLAVMENLAVL